MARSAVLSIQVVTDAAQARQQLADLGGAVGGLEGDLDRLTGPATVGAAAVAGIGLAAVTAASDAQQSAGAIEAVFGRFASQVNANAQNASTAVGLATSEYQNFATVLGSQLNNMGMPMDQVAGQTDQLIGLGADLAATFGGSTADAVSALSSLMRGERDPIERYGVSINQAALDAQLAEMGLDGLTGAAATNANAQATLALLTDQTAAAQGQFARETDSAAGSQQIATAQWQDAAATLGASLLPVVTAVTQSLGGLATWVGQNTLVVGVLLGVIGLFSGAILAANAAVKIYRTTQDAISLATKVWSKAQAALNVVMALNPVALVVLAIVALVAIVVIAYQRSETFRNIVDRLWASVRAGASAIATGFGAVISWVGRAADTVRNGLSSAWSAAQSAWNRFYNPIRAGFNNIIGLINRAKSFLSGLFSFEMPGWMRTVGGFFSRSAVAGADEAGAAMARAGVLDTTATAMAGLVAPAVFAPASGARNAGGAGAPSIVHITVNGALDPDAVARQIRSLLTRTAQRAGSAPIGGELSWA